MAHKRKQVRQAVVALLKAAGTAAGTRVFGSRATALYGVTYPLILVYAQEETFERKVMTGTPRQRKLQVSIEARLNAGADLTDTLDDLLDDLAEAIEAAMDADDTLGDTALDSVLVSTELDASADGEELIGAVRLNYEVSYLT